MKKFSAVFLIGFAVLCLFSACNIPLTKKEGTPTSTIPMVKVSKVTEYRTGPGQVYDLVGVLNPGQDVEVIGRSAGGDYLLIKNPSNPNMLVWLMNENNSLTGDHASLPVPTPPSTPTPVITLVSAGGCPTPIGGGPTPVSCSGNAPAPGIGCPTPIGGGPTPVSCSGGPPAPGSGCPTPIGGGPTPVSCSGSAPATGSGCPTPIGGGPTPVSCSGGASAPGSGCPTPIGGGPTPVSCSGKIVPIKPFLSGYPTLIGGGPTSVGSSVEIVPPKPVRGIITIPTLVQ